MARSGRRDRASAVAGHAGAGAQGRLRGVGRRFRRHADRADGAEPGAARRGAEQATPHHAFGDRGASAWARAPLCSHRAPRHRRAGAAPAAESAPAAPAGDPPPPEAPPFTSGPEPASVDESASVPASLEAAPEPARASSPRSSGPRASGVSSSRSRMSSTSPRVEPADAGAMAVASTASAPVVESSKAGLDPPPSDPTLQKAQ